MKMKKLLMTGAGLVLVTGMGITAAAVGPNLFSAGTMKQGRAVTQTSAAVYTDGVGSCHISDGYCMNWSDADGDGVCDLCRNPAYCENSAGNGEQDSGSAAGSQGQNYGGYGSGCYNSGYNGCGNSRQGHHGSGHHGSGHHR